MAGVILFTVYSAELFKRTAAWSGFSSDTFTLRGHGVKNSLCQCSLTEAVTFIEISQSSNFS